MNVRYAVGLLFAALAGCENAVEGMYDQPKLKPQDASAVWRDGRASRPREDGVVAVSAGVAADASSGTRGRIDAAILAEPYTRASIERGGERYAIYCAPCHGALGDGDGYIARRGFPAVPTFHTDRLRGARDDALVDVVAHGYGAMYPFGDRVPVEDQRSIVAYVRVLQRAERASVSDVPSAMRGSIADASDPAKGCTPDGEC